MNTTIQQLTAGFDPYHTMTPGVFIAAVATVLLIACAFAFLRYTEMRNQDSNN